jgi:hypothetical protein
MRYSLTKIINFYSVDSFNVLNLEYTVSSFVKPIIYKPSQEYFVGGSLSDYYTFVIRYLEDINLNMIIEYDGNFFEIKRIYDQDQSKKYLNLTTIKKIDHSYYYDQHLEMEI